MKSLFYILFVLAIFLLIFFLVLGFNFYPVVKTENGLVWAGEYYGMLSGFENYQKIFPVEDTEADIGPSMITFLVADKLIEKELSRRGIGPKNAKKIVDDTLVSEGENLEKASRELYGWGIKEFRNFVLLPQARQDILVEELEREGINFNDWLSSELAKADVKIYFLPYSWTEGGVVEK